METVLNQKARFSGSMNSGVIARGVPKVLFLDCENE